MTLRRPLIVLAAVAIAAAGCASNPPANEALAQAPVERFSRGFVEVISHHGGLWRL